MKRITLSILTLFFAILCMNAQLVTVATDNHLMTGETYKNGLHAIAIANDPFVYNPNNPEATAPVQTWAISTDLEAVPNSCIIINPNSTTNMMQCDYTIAEGTKLVSLDVWGRTDPAVNHPTDGWARTRYLVIELTNGVDTWTSDLWNGVSLANDGAYGRFTFDASVIPPSLLIGNATLKIGQNAGFTNWLQVYEIRLAASDVPKVSDELDEITITNAVFNGANYPGIKYHLGEFALNDTFLYNPNTPLVSPPTQGWLPDTASHCFGKIVNNPSWECDFTLEANRELYALDLWGRVWQNVSNGAYLSVSEPGAVSRSQNLNLTLTSHDSSVVWVTPVTWSGTNSDKEGAYGRYVFQTEGIPDEIAFNGGHLKISKSGSDFLHIDELRLVSSPLRNRAPLAVLGPDTTVFSQDVVTLDASASYDANGDSMSYIWMADAAIVFSDPKAIKPTFMVPDVNEKTLYTISLKVHDGADTSLLESIVFIVYPAGGNIPPVANAGNDQSVKSEVLVTLDASASYDEQGDFLSYRWVSLSQDIILSDTLAKMPTFIAPVLEMEATYVFELIVNDGKINSHIDTVNITVASKNMAPIAKAGPDLVVSTGTLVSLDATYSTDVDDAIIYYHWNSLDGPILSDTTSSSPTFTATPAGEYRFCLAVSDGKIYSDNVDTVVVKVNTPPIAIAGDDAVIVGGSTFILDGSASKDADGEAITYLWTTNNSAVILKTPSAVRCELIVPSTPGESYDIVLYVNDGIIMSQASVITLSVNTPPVAVAGLNQRVNGGETVLLDASLSSDEDGDLLTYEWESLTDTTLSLVNALSEKATFTAPNTTGIYRFALVVRDALSQSVASVIEVNVSAVLGMSVLENIACEVYPNPTANGFYVDLSNVSSAATLTLVDMQGSTIVKTLVQGNIKHYMSSENLVKGTYLLQVKTINSMKNIKISIK